MFSSVDFFFLFFFIFIYLFIPKNIKFFYSLKNKTKDSQFATFFLTTINGSNERSNQRPHRHSSERADLSH